MPARACTHTHTHTSSILLGVTTSNVSQLKHWKVNTLFFQQSNLETKKVHKIGTNQLKSSLEMALQVTEKSRYIFVLFEEVLHVHLLCTSKPTSISFTSD